MPISDTSFLQEAGKWLGTAITTALAFFAMVSKWHGSRFKAVEADVKELQSSDAEQDKDIATLKAESLSAHEQRERIEDKLDKVHELLIKKAG